jgi:[acyl-carrier-protein] S-malonyltransferase
MPVSGAFHSRLMHSAIAPLSRSLAAIQLNKPAVPVHSNVTSRQHRPGAASISRHLLEQIWKPIMWEQTMHIMYSRPAGERFPSTFEMGPGRQLGAILRQINARAFEEYVSVEV